MLSRATRSALVVALLALLAVSSLGPQPAHAAAPAGSAINFTFNFASFSSILGGSLSGSATLAGSVSADGTQLSDLRGTFNIPIKDTRLRASPTGPVQQSTSTFQVFWTLPCPPNCTPPPCPPDCTSNFATYSVTNNSAPVELRLGSMRGVGTLTWASPPVCVANCPPPGASVFIPFLPGASLFGNVVGGKDGGSISMSGPAPTVG
jgi:hypothetical protein